MLAFIWLLALALTATALLVMAGLVLMRLLTDRRDRRLEAARTALLGDLLAWLDGQVPDAAIEAKLRRDGAVGRRLIVEIFELMRGEDQERLANLAERCGVPQHLRRRLTRGSRHQRLHAAESLAWFAGAETRDLLRRALEDRDDDVALAAAASLAEQGERLPIAELLSARLGHRGDSSRRLEAVLARVAVAQMMDLLATAQDLRAPSRARAAAVDAMARTGSFELVDALAGLAGDPSALVRAAVGRGLGVLAHPGGGRVAATLLGDAHWEVRAEAAEAVGRMGLVSEAERLAELLEDENWWVRFRAGEALAVLGDQGIALLRDLARSPSDVPRRMASLVLAEKGIAA